MARTIRNHAGGSFDDSRMQDLIDADPFHGPITQLTGAADVINPHAAGNYIISRAGVDAMTIGTPTAGVDDNMQIVIVNDTLNAHTLTAPSAIFFIGQAGGTTITFLAFRGSYVILRAWQGIWQILSPKAAFSTIA